MKHINQDEYIKRLAASVGVDVLNLTISMQEQQAKEQEMMQQAQQMEMTKQAGSFAATEQKGIDSENDRIAQEQQAQDQPIESQGPPA